MLLIQVQGLSKEYSVRNRKKATEKGIIHSFKRLFRTESEKLAAVNDISFTIEQGKTVGFLGANGAGKSTLLKTLSGILVPSSGTVEVNGLVPHRDRIDHSMNIGVVFGQRTTLWWDLPLRNSFDLLRVIYEVEPDAYESTIQWLIELLDLAPILDRPVRQLSLGQRMRAELAAALLHRPQVLFLDEPTIGLDIDVKQRIRAALRDLNRHWGVTILLTTHDLQDIEEICERLIVLDQGRLMYDGALQHFREQYCGQRIIKIAFHDPRDAQKLISEPPLEVTQVKQDAAWVLLSFDHNTTSAADIVNQVMSRYAVSDLAIEEPSIEHTVAELYRGSKKGR